MLDGDVRTHDVYAHGKTTLLCVSPSDFRYILTQHSELYEALLRLQAQRLRVLFEVIEDLNSLPLRARLAKAISNLARSFRGRRSNAGAGQHLSLQLVQRELADLLGASRPRINRELKALEREQVVRTGVQGLEVCSREALIRIANLRS